ncbi:hypothetical protein, partial [Trichococcus flocculiformis]|uniref:hypothetical protein n=1 Tax=Trichococcus flocculiformis TaxID=82803 RepID=UPI0023F4DF95
PLYKAGKTTRLWRPKDDKNIPACFLHPHIQHIIFCMVLPPLLSSSLSNKIAIFPASVNHFHFFGLK